MYRFLVVRERLNYPYSPGCIDIGGLDLCGLSDSTCIHMDTYTYVYIIPMDMRRPIHHPVSDKMLDPGDHTVITPFGPQEISIYDLMLKI